MREKFNYYPWQIRHFLGYQALSRQEERPVVAITQSSLEVEEGDLFVALRGKRDGHDYLAEAFHKKAQLAIVEKDHPHLNKLGKEERTRLIEVNDTLKALGQLALSHRRRFSPIVVAVTGSSGKTTTKELLATIRHVMPEGTVVYSAKNYNNEIGVPFTLFRINEKTRLAILELAMNHGGEIERLSLMTKPDIAVITTLGEAHIEFLGSEKNIAHAKSEIFAGMQKHSQFFIPRSTSRKKIPISLARNLGLHVHETGFGLEGDILKIREERADGFELDLLGEPFFFPLPGKILLENVALAASVLLFLGFSPREIAQAFGKFQGEEHRLKIYHGDYVVIDDTYNSNPTGVKAAVSAALQLAGPKDCYAVLGDFRELGRFSLKYHKETGIFLAQTTLKDLITFGEDSFYLGQAFAKRRKNVLWQHFPNSPLEIDKLVARVKNTVPLGSVILVKGSRALLMERIVERLREHP
ncbi:MAG: UDP-N-acetylmuramoyl-tripeptide--D-alanyl-D-alanine ligase [Leptospiraceae bacterium]|nr:UDP-N-acetylmuramoyl-tripeptide--D-alanyl-D-alanine ligase [Leptospiraceae bacterium]MDW8307283.1 UDP-N-acetylmuramoyl-tripeptide--D-alanyl-D-alanine ligase [Leptospiraceae bacterium]